MNEIDAWNMLHDRHSVPPIHGGDPAPVEEAWNTVRRALAMPRRNEIDVLAELIHDISTEKGFAPPTLENLPEKLMLSVSELAEALEEHRSDAPLVYFLGEKPEGILVEIADSIIRNLHMMHSLLLEGKAVQGDPEAEGWTISKILNTKVAYNDSRPHMHGRAY